MSTLIQTVSQLAQVDPSIVHAINAPYMLRVSRDALNAPVDCIYDEKTFAEIVKRLNQQAQQEQVAQNVPKLAKAAASLAKSPESGSILQHLMGGEQNAGAA